MDFHSLFLGLLLGWGAAIPIGPVNLEMVRRNLNAGARVGISFGVGATVADLSYILLLLLGALHLMQYPNVLQTVGLLGSCFLLYFAYGAFKKKGAEADAETLQKAPGRHSVEGYFITLLNPMTILFWASVSTQFPALSQTGAILLPCVGVVLGTLSWSLFLNTLIHVTRHKLSAKTVRALNIFGGVILLSFALFGFYRYL